MKKLSIIQDIKYFIRFYKTESAVKIETISINSNLWRFIG